jgi:hypothetical protein
VLKLLRNVRRAYKKWKSLPAKERQQFSGEMRRILYLVGELGGRRAVEYVEGSDLTLNGSNLDTDTPRPSHHRAEIVSELRHATTSLLSAMAVPAARIASDSLPTTVRVGGKIAVSGLKRAARTKVAIRIRSLGPVDSRNQTKSDDQAPTWVTDNRAGLDDETEVPMSDLWGNIPGPRVPGLGVPQEVIAANQREAFLAAEHSQQVPAHLTPEQAEADEYRRRQATDETASQAAVEQRISETLTMLRANGTPGLYARRLKTVERAQGLRKAFGRSAKDVVVDAEGAWPIGRFTWTKSGPHGVDLFGDLPSGYTSGGRIVPLEEGTEGDPVDVLYRRWRLYDGEWGCDDPKEPTPADVLSGLEVAAKKAGLIK